MSFTDLFYTQILGFFKLTFLDRGYVWRASEKPR